MCAALPALPGCATPVLDSAVALPPARGAPQASNRFAIFYCRGTATVSNPGPQSGRTFPLPSLPRQGCGFRELPPAPFWRSQRLHRRFRPLQPLLQTAAGSPRRRLPNGESSRVRCTPGNVWLRLQVSSPVSQAGSVTVRLITVVPILGIQWDLSPTSPQGPAPPTSARSAGTRPRPGERCRIETLPLLAN